MILIRESRMFNLSENASILPSSLVMNTLVFRMVTNAGEVTSMEVKVEFLIANATMFATMIKDTHVVERIETRSGTYLLTTATKLTNLYVIPKSITQRIAPRKVATTHVIYACNLATVRRSSTTKNHVAFSVYLTTL